MVLKRLPVVILPSDRVPGRVLLVLPILEARRRRNRDEIAKKGSRLEGFGTRYKYMPKGGISGGLGGPGAPQRGQEGGRATRAPGALVAPPAVPWAHGSFWNADFLYNFSGFFLAVLVM